MYIYFKTTYMTTLLFYFLIGQKQWREKKEERGREDYVSERESCPKNYHKWLYKYHFSKNYYTC